MFEVRFLLVLSFLSGILAKAVPLPPDPKLHPDTGLNVLQIIQRHGYPVEQHWVTTVDGYILGVHRIPHGLNNAAEVNKPVVLLVHGLMSSSADWINMGPEKSIGFLLADMGYDVWLANVRGNTWSRNHTILDPDAENHLFWLFSWNEIGLYDLPATIDHITAATEQEKIFYIGHSQGTTSFYVMATERPEYNDKIRLMVSFAPVAYMSNIENPFLQFLAEIPHTLEIVAQLIGLYEFLPHNQLIATLGAILCDDEIPYQEICANILFLVGGVNSEQLNRTMLPVIFSNVPAGTSVKQFIHYAQGINSGYFRKCDYGLLENLIRYGQLFPPRYDLNKITAPVSLFYGDNDILASVIDVHQLQSELPNVVLDHRVDLPQFTHLDFIWAIDVIPLLYDIVFKLMSEF